MSDEKLHAFLNQIPAIIPEKRVQEIRIKFVPEQDTQGQVVFLPQLTVLAKE
jgi:hypothetical protein